MPLNLMVKHQLFILHNQCGLRLWDQEQHVHQLQVNNYGMLIMITILHLVTMLLIVLEDGANQILNNIKVMLHYVGQESITTIILDQYR
jgi:hypothetical protein